MSLSEVSGIATAPALAGVTETTPGVREVEVKIENLSFNPQTVTIRAGEAVRWLNTDSISHTVVADDDSFKSDLINESGIFVHTFTKPGTYRYHCSIHPKSMTGIVVVK